MSAQKNKKCKNSRQGTLIKELQLEPTELVILKISRYYFLNFVDPIKQNWLNAINEALDKFGHKKGPEIAVTVLAAIQTMRRSRISPFCFNSPECECCSIFITDNERNFLNIVRSVSKGNMKKASTYGFVLCESNEPEMLIKSIQILTKICDSN
jgi:hypothetical protein